MTRARPPLPLPDPPLTYGPITLRPWAAGDAAALAAAWGDAEIRMWTGVPERADETAARLWIAGEADRRARGLALDLVIDLAGTVAGEIGLMGIDPLLRSADIGWWVSPRHRRAGLAGQAARLVSTWALSELCVDAVVARCHPDNPASAAVASAAGFAHAGTAGELDLWRCC